MHSLAGRLTTVACVFFFFFFFFFLTASCARPIREIPSTKTSAFGVQLRSNHHNHHNHQNHVVIDNGIVEVTFGNPGGDIVGIKYKGMDNVLQRNKEKNRGYWDMVWSSPQHRNSIDKLQGAEFRVVSHDEDQIEISFTKKWDYSMINTSVPLNVDKRYILRSNEAGIYMYTILERLEGWPDADMSQIRVAFKLQGRKFHYMALSDDRQRVMPTERDRISGQTLAYPEAVLLTNPDNPALQGEVDDKYMYTCEHRDNLVHGWISDDPAIGVWMITPSYEFRAGGPVKQQLTSHVGPTLLNVFTGGHYVGRINAQYRDGEAWKKVFGPVFLYLNSVTHEEDHRHKLWQDAKHQAVEEVKKWPYSFPQSEDFPSSDQRGTVVGRLLVHDRYTNERVMPAKSAYVGLAAPGEVGSWATESKDYQFWTQTNGTGHFEIKNVRTGDYNLYAWVPGFMGEYKYDANINVQPGSKTKLGSLRFFPPRNGPTLWEIGIPDRSAGEFYVPDPYATLTNNLYANSSTDKFRQYGLWARYADLYPDNDLTYTIGNSDYRQDWFFAQVTRDIGNGKYQSTTWQINFELETVNRAETYTLQLALAAASFSEIQVRVNNPYTRRPLFATKLIGRDNAIARHGIHGLYWPYSITIPGSQLQSGQNTIYLTQSRSNGPFVGVMYDYIRLEGPRET